MVSFKCIHKKPNIEFRYIENKLEMVQIKKYGDIVIGELT